MKILNRARHLYSDEYFISESIKFEHNQMYLLVKGKWRECDEATRSIHFKDMIDVDGTKIFVSLSKYGKGGDIVHQYTEYEFLDEEDWANYEGVVIYKNGMIGIAHNNETECLKALCWGAEEKVIGIKK